MAKRVIFWIFFGILNIGFIFAENLTLQDVPEMMERFFAMHVEYHDFNPHLMKRFVKNYIDQFDPEKIYLLHEEIYPFLNLTDLEAAKIIVHVKTGNFEDFIHLNQLFNKAINRAKDIRGKIRPEIVNGPLEGNFLYNTYTSYAKTEQALTLRQKQFLRKFFSLQIQQSVINTTERKEKVLTLLEKRIERAFRYFSESAHQEGFLMMRAFAKSLDAHTNFFSEEEAQEMRMSLEKQFEGVGVILAESIDGVIVSDLIKHSPASECGQIHKNDLVLEINGLDVSHFTFEQVLQTMKASEKDITLGICTMEPNSVKKGKVCHVKLTRQPISMDEERLTYAYEEVDGGIIGHLNLPSFYENENGITSEEDIKFAIKELEKIGKIKGIILDLRENAGGFLSQAIKVGGLFISNGVIVISKYGNEEIRYLRTSSGKPFYSGPLILLTSKLSASASEIVAQALQDYGVALIVGDERTFGKGSIQYQTVTDMNANWFYKITIGKYYTVSGKTTQIAGVKADLVVPTLYAPYAIGERFLDYPLPTDQVKAVYQDIGEDIDAQMKVWFQKTYLPNLQKKVSLWQEMLPELKERSSYRMAHDAILKNYFDKQREIQKTSDGFPREIIRDANDVPLIEASNILKDMIRIFDKNQKISTSKAQKLVPIK
jgi:carboxyl-terminal processing protease